MQEIKFNMPVTVTQNVQIPFIDALVKMVDHIRTGDYSEEAKKDGIDGCELVIKALKSKTGNRAIVGSGNKNIPLGEIAEGINKRLG